MTNDEDNDTYGSLCRHWGKRQTWTSKQFLCLLSGADPDDPQKERAQQGSSLEAIDPGKYKSRNQILRSYIGTSSLSPLNPTVPDEEQVFHKTDLVAVAAGQGWDVLKVLEAAAEPYPAEDWANTGKGSLLLIKRRQRALKEFITEIYHRAEKLHFAWARPRRPLPITKNDLYEAFKKREPSLVRITFSTFMDDLKTVGAKFSHGRKPNSSKILTRVLSSK